MTRVECGDHTASEAKTMNGFFTRPRVAAVIAVAALGLQSAAFAAPQATDPAAIENDNTGGAVTFSGRLLMRVRTASGGYSADQRASEIEGRLVPILSLHNILPDDVTVEQTRPYQDAAIYVRGQLLVTVDKSLAQANGNNDPGALAREWADRMRRILPEVSVKSNENDEADGRAMNAAAAAPAPAGSATP